MFCESIDPTCLHGAHVAHCGCAGDAGSRRISRRSLGVVSLGLAGSVFGADFAMAQGGVAPAANGGPKDIVRRTLQRTPTLGNDQELVMLEVVFPPGVAAPVHHHTVPGLNFIVEGVAESAYGNDAPRRYQVGETLVDLADTPHTIFRNPDPQKQLRFLIFYAALPGRLYTVVP